MMLQSFREDLKPLQSHISLQKECWPIMKKRAKAS
jgi:hypothetical protein